MECENQSNGGLYGCRSKSDPIGYETRYDTLFQSQKPAFFFLLLSFLGRRGAHFDGGTQPDVLLYVEQATCDSNGIKCCDGANAACNKQWSNFDPSLSCADMGGCGKTGISNDDGYCRCDALCVFDPVPENAFNGTDLTTPPNELGSKFRKCILSFFLFHSQNFTLIQ